LDTISIGGLSVSRFIIGGNPISGFGHQGPELSREMVSFFTAARVVALLREAETLGINTLLARADKHIMRTYIEYREGGGTIQWIAQSCPELKNFQRSLDHALRGGAVGLYVHGGEADFRLAHGTLAEVQPQLDSVRAEGLVTGIAGHNPEVFRFAEQHLDCDHYMCCYYNPSSREHRPDHDPGARERYNPEDRARMLDTIPALSRPVIHYKILAAGRNDPAEAFEVAARAMRSTDAVCVGVFPKHKPDMLATDVRLFEEALAAARV
jgi:hypothetical protein